MKTQNVIIEKKIRVVFRESKMVMWHAAENATDIVKLYEYALFFLKINKNHILIVNGNSNT